MSFASKAVGFATVVGLATGVMAYTEPKTFEELDRHRMQEQTEQLSDAQQKNVERIREEGDRAAEADRFERLRPVEPRPAPRRLPVRFRVVP
jgi:hypothetical protein